MFSQSLKTQLDGSSSQYGRVRILAAPHVSSQNGKYELSLRLRYADNEGHSGAQYRDLNSFRTTSVRCLCPLQTQMVSDIVFAKFCDTA